MRLTFAEAHALFDYDPDTGALTWAAGGGKIRHGRKAGAMTNGRIQVRLPDGQTALATRIIWLWMTGQKAKGYLRHANEDTTDTRWDNLYACKAEDEAQHYLWCSAGLWYATIFVGQDLTSGPYADSNAAAASFSSMLKSFVGIVV